MGTCVLFPSTLDSEPFARLEDIDLLAYDDPSHWPPGADRAEVLVVGWGHADDVHPWVPGLGSLRLIQVIGAGVEQWIGHVPDGVMLSNARGAHGAATAEWAMAALLAVVREVPRFVRDQDRRVWMPRTSATLVGSRILVIGAGDLAQELRRRLEAFDAVVTLVGRSERPGVASIDRVHELLPQQDAVVVTVPQSPETIGLVDAQFLSRMPDGAVLVNAARGPVVDTTALLAELQVGRLRAALDVTDPEPLPPEHPLWSAPGLLLTPHVGGSTEQATERGIRVAAEQVAQFVAGAVPENVQNV